MAKRLDNVFVVWILVTGCTSGSEGSPGAIDSGVPATDGGAMQTPLTTDSGNAPTPPEEAGAPPTCDPVSEGFSCEGAPCSEASTACVVGADSTYWSAWVCVDGRWVAESCVEACGEPRPVSGAVMEYGACIAGRCECGTRSGCGNGVVEDRPPIGQPEECEPGMELPCLELPSVSFVEGTARCGDNCAWETLDCRSICGDGVVGTGETCEPNMVWDTGCGQLGYLQDAPIPCGASCRWDESVCGGARCGNLTVETGEVCDYHRTPCADVGLGLGSASCRYDCLAWDTRGCTECGNGEVEGGEVCELGSTSPCTTFGWELGTATCGSDCLGWNTSGCSGAFCGDGVVGGTEICDRNSQACPSGGSAPCRANCTGWRSEFCTQASCGNGTVEGDERCDGDTIRCVELAYPDLLTSGNARCLSDCTGYDESTCGTCGDGVVNGDEVCDGGSVDCANGLVAPCFDNCNGYHTSVCHTSTTQPVCGNGVREAGEVCDGGPLDCSLLVNGTGSAPCNGTCSGYDTSNCGSSGGSTPSGECADLSSCVVADFRDSIVYFRNDCSGDVTVCAYLERPDGSWIKVCDLRLSPAETWCSCYQTTGQFQHRAIPYSATTSVKSCFPGWTLPG